MSFDKAYVESSRLHPKTDSIDILTVSDCQHWKMESINPIHIHRRGAMVENGRVERSDHGSFCVTSLAMVSSAHAQ